MAIQIDIAQRIARPPADVFAFVADIEGWPKWLIASGIVAVHRAPGRAGTPVAGGETMIIEQRAAGRAGTFAVTVSGVEPGRRLALAGKDDDGVKIAIDAVVVPAAPDHSATELRWSFRIDLPFRFRIFEGMATPQVRQAAGLDLEALRLRLESSARD
jgi:uncharacterized protein YndB with AHSA1/START domain